MWVQVCAEARRDDYIVWDWSCRSCDCSMWLLWANSSPPARGICACNHGYIFPASLLFLFNRAFFCCCCCCCTFRAISCVFSWCLLLMNIKQIKIVLFYLLAAQLHRENLWEFKYQPLTLTELFQGQQEAALSNQCSKYARYSAALKTCRNPRT